MKKLHTRRGGFTLIELMIVVAIIGILAAIAIPNFLRFQLKAKSSEGKTNLAAIRTAEESYFAEYGNYISALPSPPTAQCSASGERPGAVPLGRRVGGRGRSHLSIRSLIATGGRAFKGHGRAACATRALLLLPARRYCPATGLSG